MGMQEAERGDEFLQALFRLQEHLESKADRVKLPKKVGAW
jgi:hypothetical protein